MAEGDVCVGTDKGAEVDPLTGTYGQVWTIVWEIGTLRLYTVHLGYMRTNGFETPVEGSTLGTYEGSAQTGCALREDSTCSASNLPFAVGLWRIS